MPVLYLVIFEVTFPAPKRTAHWALYLPPENPNAQAGQLYSVQKQSLSSSQTLFFNKEFIPEDERRASYIEIPGVNIAAANLLAICQEVANNRNFNLVTRNCQDWVLDVIKQVENELNLKRIDVVALARMYGYDSLKG